MKQMEQNKVKKIERKHVDMSYMIKNQIVEKYY